MIPEMAHIDNEKPDPAYRRERLGFEITLLPPSVNHYVKHSKNGIHRKTPAAKAFENSFKAMMPARARECYVVGRRFKVELTIIPAPAHKGDIDNYPKLILDCCASAGFLRSSSGQRLSDANFKDMRVILNDEPEQRQRGPLVAITIEALS